MPHHSDAAIAGQSRAQRLLQSQMHRVKLVIAGHLLGEHSTAHVFEHDKVADQIEEAALLKNAFEYNLQLGQTRHCFLPGDRPPRLEPLPVRTDRPDASVHAVGHHKGGIGGEERGNFSLISLKLLEPRPDRGVLVRWVLQFDHRECETIDEEHNVRAARALAIAHRELVYREPIIVGGIVEIQNSGLRASDRTVFTAILDCNSIHYHAMDGSILFD